MAIIDSSIAMGVKPMQIESPMNALAQAMQLKQLQQQGQMGEMQMQESQRGVAADNALAQLLAGGKSGADVSTGLASQGYGKQALDYTKQMQAAAKDKAAAEKEQLSNTMTKLSLGAQLLGGVTDQASYDAARATAQANGLDVSRMQPNYDPAFVAQKLKEGLTVKEQLEQYWKQKGYDTPDANARLSAQTAANGQQITMRGQDMTDARARESTAATMSKPFEVTGPDGAPVLVKQGQIVPVTGYSPKSAKDKPMTDAQSKAALFGSRMQAANEVLDSLATAGTTTSIPGARAGFGVGAVLNTVSSAKQQQLNQAKRDFVNAVLRRESGAVISDGEFDNAEKQYFPQVGDSKEVISQKKNNREIAMRGVQAEVPKGQRGVINEIIGGNPIDSLLDKYK
ncbi:MAG TPA: hypothetical protein PKV65_16575 [Acidovorax defluvii]|nr:hypothetical protein [Acidovorax defluvii]